MDPIPPATYVALSLDECRAERSRLVGRLRGLENVIREKEAVLAPLPSSRPDDVRKQLHAKLAADAAASVTNSSKAQIASPSGASAAEDFSPLPAPEGLELVMRNPWAETEDGNGTDVPKPSIVSGQVPTETSTTKGSTAVGGLMPSKSAATKDSTAVGGPLPSQQVAAKALSAAVGSASVAPGVIPAEALAAPKPRQVDTRHHKLPPNHIRDARKEYVDQYARTGEVSEEIVGRAFGMPKVLCDNSGCDQLHIADDCELPLLCEACISKDHTRTTCEAKCTRCGGPGHSLNRCSASKVFGKQVKLTTPKVLQDIPPRSGELLVRTPKAPLQARLWKQAQLRARELGLPHQSTALVAVPKLSAPASASAVKPPPTSSPTSFAAVIGRDLPASKAPSSLATNVATSSTLSAPERERIVSTHAGPGSIFATGSRSCVPATDVRLSQMTAGETRSIATPADTRSSQMTATATSSVSDSLMEREFASPRVCHLCGEKTKHKPQDCPQRKCFKCQQKGHREDACPRHIECSRCHKKGHDADRCPNSNCSKCHQKGHQGWQCKYCRRCHQLEHAKPEDCPSWICIGCGGQGHDAKDCVKKVCYKCHRPGHKAAQCPIPDRRDPFMDQPALSKPWSKEQLDVDDATRTEKLRAAAVARKQDGSDEPNFFQQTFSQVTGEDRRKISTVSTALPYYTPIPMGTMGEPADAGDSSKAPALVSTKGKEKSVDTEDSSHPLAGGRFPEPRKDWFGDNIVPGERIDWANLDDSEDV